VGQVGLADAPPRAGLEPQVAHSWQPFLPEQRRQFSEETLAGWVTFGHWIGGLDIPPAEVRLQHAALADTAEYQRISRCPVLFDQADNALIYPRQLLATPLGQADGQARLMPIPMPMLTACSVSVSGAIACWITLPGVVAATAGRGCRPAANRRAFSAQSAYSAAAFARGRVIIQPVGGSNAATAGVALPA
jgi:hypothetical protein